MVTCLASCGGNKTEVYKNSAAPVKDRIEDLLGRMTLEEKVGQMNQFVGLEHIKANSAVMTEEELKNNTANAFYPGRSPCCYSGIRRIASEYPRM